MFGGDGNDGEAEFLVGEAASLEPIRAAISQGNEETIEIALKQLLDESSEERILMPRMASVVSLQQTMEEEEENGGSHRSANNNFQDVKGHSIVTSERFLFVASPREDEASPQSFDLSIDSECIHLHAQSADPVSIYLQLENENDEANPTEVTIIPIPGSSSNEQENCQELFSKLSELISLHPISHGDDDGGGGMMGLMGMMMGANGGGGDNNGMISRDGIHMENYGDDMIVAPSRATNNPTTASDQFDDCEDEEQQEHLQKRQRQEGKDDDSDPGATPEERAAMLAHLDSILVVKPGLEKADGQFDDADNDAKMINADSTHDDAPVVQKQEQRASMGDDAGQFDDAEGDDDDKDDPIL